MAKAKKNLVYDGPVPFDCDNNHIYVADYGLDYYWGGTPRERWAILRKSNYIFDDGLAIISAHKVRMHHVFQLVSVNDGHKYTIPATEMPHIFSLATIFQQEIDGVWRLVLACHWTFKKHADKYFVTAIDPEQIEA